MSVLRWASCSPNRSIPGMYHVMRFAFIFPGCRHDYLCSLSSITLNMFVLTSLPPSAMQTLNSSVRIRAEGFGVVAKPVVTFLILLCDSVYGSSSLGLLAFALGQFAYAVVMLVVYLSEFGTSVPFTPQNPGQARSRLRGYFDEALIKVSMAMTAQSLLKHFLTEGDKVSLHRNPFRSLILLQTRTYFDDSS